MLPGDAPVRALVPYEIMSFWRQVDICCRCRPREAIECMKRALIGADPNETNLHLRLAKLYHDLNEFTEAASYHQHIVEVGRAASAYLFLFCRMSPSILILPSPLPGVVCIV